MKPSRPLITGILVMTLLLVVTTWFQGSRVKLLQMAEAAALQRLNDSSAEALAASEAKTVAPAAPTASPELLKLRSEVARLTARKRELATVAMENQRLRSEVPSAGPQDRSSQPLPPGYVRKSQAQFAGFTSPENTMQSFLWALQRRDVTNILQAFTPGMAQRISADNGLSDPGRAEQFLKRAQAFIGYRILKQEQNPDGSMKLNVEVLPDMPAGDVRFELVDGQWKLASAL